MGLLTIALLAGCTGRAFDDSAYTAAETAASTTADTSTDESSDSGASDTGTSTDTEPDPDTDASTDTGADTEDEEPYEFTPEDLAEIDAVEGELLAIVEGALAYFAVARDDGGALHRCPHPHAVPVGGEAGITPPYAFNCNRGPQGKCMPLEGGGGAGIYDMAMWYHNDVWLGVGFEREEGVPHEFKYNFVMQNAVEGYGACQFTAYAYADFDDDAEFSIYSISGAVDENGEVVDAMVVQMPFE